MTRKNISTQTKVIIEMIEKRTQAEDRSLKILLSRLKKTVRGKVITISGTVTNNSI